MEAAKASITSRFVIFTSKPWSILARAVQPRQPEREG
jgi:hypothetical protein